MPGSPANVLRQIDGLNPPLQVHKRLRLEGCDDIASLLELS
jgi:hypothetical protein